MNIKKNLLIILTIFCYSIPSYAVNIINTYSWDSDEYSGVNYRVDNKNSTQSFYAQISHSKDGEQRLYFYNIDSDVFVKPEYMKLRSDRENMLSSIRASNDMKKRPTTTVTMVFNGQAVKMTQIMESYFETQKTYFYFTADTEKGHNYLINLFKKSKSPIKVEYRDQTFLIPSDGFTKKWNSNGGNAI